MRSGFLCEICDDLGMELGNIASFAWILRQVEQQRRIVFRSRLAFTVGVARDEVRLEGSLPDRAKLVVPVVIQDASRGVRPVR